MREFTLDQPATRVIFGAGSIRHLAEETKRLGAVRVLVVATPGKSRDAEEAAQRLGDTAVGLFAQPALHVPIETARAACEVARQCHADCCVAIGGGSTIGLAKAIAHDLGLPIVAVPTTYSGSEATPIYGFTENGIKRTARDRKVLPSIVIYDPELAATLPPSLAGTSGMNALAHSVEALYAPDTNRFTSLLAAESIRALARSLPLVVGEAANLDAIGEALYGAWLAGSTLGLASMGIHHKLCHTLGGTFGLAHAEVHTVILPHATAFNREAAPGAMRVIAEALGAEDAAQGVYDLAARLGAPVALRDIGMPAEGLDRAAKLATENPYSNPRPVEYAGVRQLLEEAWYGRRPQSTRAAVGKAI